MASEQEEELSDLRSLVKSRGWDRLVKIAEAQCENRQITLLAPLDSANPYPQEFMKGEIAGIRLFLRLPGITIEQLTKDMESSNDDSTEA